MNFYEFITPALMCIIFFMKRDKMVSLMITDELKKQIQELASKEDRSVSYICQRALVNEVKETRSADPHFCISRNSCIFKSCRDLLVTIHPSVNIRFQEAIRPMLNTTAFNEVILERQHPFSDP